MSNTEDMREEMVSRLYPALFAGKPHPELGEYYMDFLLPADIQGRQVNAGSRHRDKNQADDAAPKIRLRLRGEKGNAQPGDQTQDRSQECFPKPAGSRQGVVILML
jgi:hypothetical protein